MKKNSKNLFKEKLKVLLYYIYAVFHGNSHLSQISFKKSFLRKTKIKGNKNNTILVEDGCTLDNVSICFYGQNNEVIIGKESALISTNLRFDGDNNIIIFGKRCWIFHDSFFSAGGTKIEIGDDCMFGSGVDFWTHDGHPVFDLSSKKQLNLSKNIYVGSHCWIGHDVTLLKGSLVGGVA